MNQQDQSQQQENIESVLAWLDELHSAASEGTATELSQMNQRELVAYLREVIYTAQETIRELQSQPCAQMPILRMVNKIEKVG